MKKIIKIDRESLRAASRETKFAKTYGPFQVHIAYNKRTGEVCSSSVVGDTTIKFRDPDWITIGYYCGKASEEEIEKDIERVLENGGYFV